MVHNPERQLSVRQIAEHLGFVFNCEHQQNYYGMTVVNLISGFLNERMATRQKLLQASFLAYSQNRRAGMRVTGGHSQVCSGCVLDPTKPCAKSSSG